MLESDSSGTFEVSVAVIAAILALILIAAAVAVYSLWRGRRATARRAGGYRQQLDRWEREGYDVSSFRKKWDGRLRSASTASGMPRLAYVLIGIVLCLLAVGGWTGVAGYFPPWDSDEPAPDRLQIEEDQLRVPAVDSIRDSQLSESP